MRAWCETNQIRCLYFLCSADDADTIHALEDAGFHLMGIRVTLERAIGHKERRQDVPVDSAPESSGTQPARAFDVDALRAVARTSHRDTRFHADPGFPADRCDELYATWIEKSCSGYADHVIVAERDGSPVGYLSLHVDGANARVGLVGVDAAWRRHGIGRELLTGAIAWLSSRGVERLSVVTPGRNVAAQALYQSMGFRTSDVQLWYHCWFESAPGDV
jgi:ribosomal protein S18 acetylase RimI-like enzyme